jgi:hypothetical protein
VRSRGTTAPYQRIPKLFADLPLARGDGRYTRIQRALGSVQLLILDDWGLEPLDAPARHDLLEIVEERYGRRSTIITSSQMARVDRRFPPMPTPFSIASSTTRTGSVSPATGCDAHAPRLPRIDRAATECKKLSASEAPDPGRHHVGTPGGIVSECLGDFVGIGSASIEGLWFSSRRANTISIMQDRELLARKGSDALRRRNTIWPQKHDMRGIQ